MVSRNQPSTMEDGIEKFKPLDRILIVAQGGTGMATLRCVERYLASQGAGLGIPLNGVQVEALAVDTDAGQDGLAGAPDTAKKVLVDDKSVREMLRKRGLDGHVTSPGPVLDTSASGASADPRNAILKQIIVMDRPDPKRNPVAAMEEIFRLWKNPEERPLGEAKIFFVGGGHGGTGPGIPYLQVHGRDTLRKVFGQAKAAAVKFLRYIMSPESAERSLKDPVNRQRHLRNYAATLINAVRWDEHQGLQMAPDQRWVSAGGPLSDFNFMVNSSNSQIEMDGHYDPAEIIAASLISQAFGTSTDAQRNNAQYVRTAETSGPNVPITDRSMPVFSALGGARLKLSDEYRAASFNAQKELFERIVGLSGVDEAVIGERAKTVISGARLKALSTSVRIPDDLTTDQFGDISEVPANVSSTVSRHLQAIRENVPANARQVLRDNVPLIGTGAKELILRVKTEQGLRAAISLVQQLCETVETLRRRVAQNLEVATREKAETAKHIEARTQRIMRTRIPGSGFLGKNKRERELALLNLQEELEGQEGLIVKCQQFAELSRDEAIFTILHTSDRNDGNIFEALATTLDEARQALDAEKLQAEGFLLEEQRSRVGRIGDGDANRMAVAFDMEFTPTIATPELHEADIASLRQILGANEEGWTKDSMAKLWGRLSEQYIPDEQEDLLRTALRKGIREALMQRSEPLMIPASGTAERQLESGTVIVQRTFVPVDDTAHLEPYKDAGYPNPVAVGRGGDLGIVQEKHRVLPMQDSVARRALMALLDTPANIDDATKLSERYPGERGLDALLNRESFFTWQAEARDPNVLRAFFQSAMRYLYAESGEHGEIRECENEACGLPFYLSEPLLAEEAQEIARKRKPKKSPDDPEEDPHPTSYDYCPGCRRVYGERDAIVEEQ